MTTSKKKGLGLAAIILACPLVAYYEGTVLTSYKDPVGIPTVCNGETDKSIVTMKERFTAQECTALLGASMMVHAQEVAGCISKPLLDREAAAVISWSYNVGSGAACSSTLVKKINAGAPANDWCAELKRWTFAGGKQLQGLVKRRDAEYKMCTKGVWQ